MGAASAAGIIQKLSHSTAGVRMGLIPGSWWPLHLASFEGTLAGPCCRVLPPVFSAQERCLHIGLLLKACHSCLLFRHKHPLQGYSRFPASSLDSDVAALTGLNPNQAPFIRGKLRYPESSPLKSYLFPARVVEGRP